MAQRCERLIAGLLRPVDSWRNVAASILTRRLELIPMTPEFLRASIDGRVRDAGELLGASLPSEWPDAKPVLELRLRQLEAEPALQPWLLRAIVLRGDRRMVGHIGFHAAPGAEYLEEWSRGGVEYGFTVFPSHRRRGYAREASLALMQWAVNFHAVPSFVLTISPANLPSRALAASLGFTRVGSHMDDIDGVEDVFVRDAG